MKPNRDKRPDGEWKEFQTRRATQAELKDMFADGAPLGVVTGAVSGNLVMAEVEGRAAGLVLGIRDLAHDSGLGELWDKVDQGWKEISPSGGTHWFFRQQSPPSGNRKLARRPSTPEELEAWKGRETRTAEDIPDPAKRQLRLQKIAATTVNDVVQVLAETRGEGGFVVVSPTPGHFHETGNAWRMARGCAPEQVPTLTDDEAEAFLGLLSTIDVPVPGKQVHNEPVPVRRPDRAGVFGGMSPGDDYERTPWEDILIPHGWKLNFQDSSGAKYWIRPGKNFGISASTGRDPERDRLYVFTTSTTFDAEVPYTKFGAYAHLNHDNDYKAAASQLRKEGFGRDPEIAATTPPRLAAAPEAESPTRQDKEVPAVFPGPVVAGSSSNLATVTELHPKQPVSLSRSEAGNAMRFVNAYETIVRFHPESNAWFVWENTRWIKQGAGGGKAAWLVQEMVSNLPTHSEEDKKWKAKSSTAHMVRAVLALASANPRIIAEAFDIHAWELNTPGGIVNLRTGEIMAPDSSRMHRKSTAVTPDYQADKSAWLAFLDATFPGQPQMIEFLQRAAGMTLVGEVREHVILFGHGKGRNGKGVTFETMANLLGDYAQTTAPDFLIQKPFSDHPEEIARLSGIRMLLSSEVNKKAKFDEARANLLSGGDKLTGRFMAKSTFDFHPSHQLWMSGNHFPKVEGGGAEGFWERIRVIPFMHMIPREERDPGLKLKLQRDHGPAILAWMVEGAVKYAQHGLEAAEPASVRAASQAYRESTDTLAMFVQEECLYVPQEDRETVMADMYGNIPRVPVSQFFNRYSQWCKDNGDRPLGKREMAADLKERFGIQSSNANRTATGQRQYEWIGLLDRNVTLGLLDEEPEPK